MRIGLIIADFEMSYTTSFQHTARAKYGVDFNSSNIDALAQNLKDLKNKVELKQFNNVHVGYEMMYEDVVHVESLLNQILANYRETFQVLPPNMKVYEVIKKLKDANTPSAKDLAKEALTEILNPERTVKLTKSQRLDAEAEKITKQRALDAIRKNSAKNK